MATTQRAYRSTIRGTRYPTKLKAFSNGMYLTEQVVPDGYAKSMVNFDIDVTGSHIKPKPGRLLKQDLKYPRFEDGSFKNGWGTTPILSDYVYLHKEEASQSNMFNPDIIDTVDVILTELGDGAVYDTDTESFKRVYNNNSSIKNTYLTKDNGDYVFDKPIKNRNTTRPTYTVCNNTLYTVDTSIIRNYLYRDAEGDYCFSKLPVEKKQPNALEAASAGYNLLLEQPYKFKDNNTGSWSIHGMLAYDIADTTYETPLLSPTTGQDIKIKVNYSYKPGTTMHYKVEILNTQSYEDTWETLIKSTTEAPKTIVGAAQGSTANNFVFTINAKYSQFALRVTVDTTPAFNGSEIFSGVSGFTCDSEALKRYKLAKPDFSKTKYMVNWFSYVGLYGIEGYLDTIFFTDIENPGYVPFPNNTLVFDNTILAVKPYLDYLLVITVDSIYLITIGANIMLSTQKKLLSNIYITEIDAQNTVILNDQIFVKTTDQFYVFKPNSYTSDATDLKNYVISTAIDNLTKNFTKETIKLLNTTYKTTCQKITDFNRKKVCIEDFDVIDMKAYTIGSDVHYVSRLIPKFTDNITGMAVTNDTVLYNGLYEWTDTRNIIDATQKKAELGYNTGVDMHLVYDSVVRSWRIYFESFGNTVYYYYDEDAQTWAPTANTEVKGTIGVLFKNKTTGNYFDILVGENEVNDNHMYIIEKTYNSTTDTINLYKDTPLYQHFDMYQYLDTGVISLEDMYMKRFREVQLNLVNAELTTIPFHIDFKLDGQEHISATNYIINHITDTNDPDYGMIYITPVETDNFNLYGTTAFASDVLASDHWQLDLSKFPELTLVTVRFELKGKGRHASLQLLNDSLKRYELSDINWVYRAMNGR